MSFIGLDPKVQFPRHLRCGSASRKPGTMVCPARRAAHSAPDQWNSRLWRTCAKVTDGPSQSPVGSSTFTPWSWRQSVAWRLFEPASCCGPTSDLWFDFRFQLSTFSFVFCASALTEQETTWTDPFVRNSFSASDGEKVAKPDEVFPGSGEGLGVRDSGDVSHFSQYISLC